MWEWLGEALAVDFANTTKRRGAEHRELLRVPQDLCEWTEREAGRVRPVPAAGVPLPEVLRFRDDVQALLHAVSHTERVPRDVADRVNARARAVPLVPQLRGRDLSLEPAGAPDPLGELLARVAHSAIELAARGGVGFCDAPSCGQFFERGRRSQKWCSDACGTRARVARHARRHSA